MPLAVFLYYKLSNEPPSTHMQVFLMDILYKMDFASKYCRIALHGCANLHSHHNQPCLKMSSAQDPTST